MVTVEDTSVFVDVEAMLFFSNGATDLNNVRTVHPLLQPLIGHGKVRVHIVIPKLHSDIS